MTSPVSSRPSDCAWGAFDDVAPWVLDPNNISWEKQAIELRVSAQREVPVLTTPTRIPPVARLVVVVWVLSKALVPWFVKKKLRPFATPEDSRAYISLRMRKAVERLGSTYIKLGQIISRGEGLFPAELVNEFTLCRDQVPAIPFESVKKTIESELGKPLTEVFSYIDTTALAAASMRLPMLGFMVRKKEVATICNSRRFTRIHFAAYAQGR